VTDPALLERAAAADRLTRQVMADVDGRQPGSPATARAPRQATTRGLAAAQVQPEAERQADVVQVKAAVMPELRPGPEPAEANTAQLEAEPGAYARGTRHGAAAPEVAEADQAAHATQAEPGAGLEPSAWQPPAADVSPEWGAQAEAETDEPEIEL